MGPELMWLVSGFCSVIVLLISTVWYNLGKRLDKINGHIESHYRRA